MSGNHSLDDPIDADELDDVDSAGDYSADERSTVSEETGTRYDVSGETEATPEDETRWDEAEEL